MGAQEPGSDPGPRGGVKKSKLIINCNATLKKEFKFSLIFVNTLHSVEFILSQDCINQRVHDLTPGTVSIGRQ